MKKISWFFTELMKMYSSKDKSYFSKKRIESGIAFIIGQWGMVYFLLANYSKFSMTDFTFWSGLEFTVAGWMIHNIQKEKSNSNQE